MRKLFTFLALVLSIGFTAQATDRTPQQNIEAEATAQTRAMEKNLNFNEFEYIQIKKISKQRLLEINAAKTELATDSNALIARLAQIENDYDKAVLKILNVKSHSAYAQLRQAKTTAENPNGVF